MRVAASDISTQDTSSDIVMEVANYKHDMTQSQLNEKAILILNQGHAMNGHSKTLTNLTPYPNLPYWCEHDSARLTAGLGWRTS